MLVTGDRDLLEVDRDDLSRHRLGRLAIVTPAQFVRELGA
jgi:predicted nucleic acid-binding protein